jgi:2-keto-4-pentenoate hydratase
MPSRLAARQISEIAQRLLEAECTRHPIPPLTSQYPEITAEDAYAIQLAIIEEKKRLGASVVGKKAGLTSQAMQKFFGVTEPDYGHLLSGMMVEDGGVISREEVIQPRAEPEIAFVLEKDLQGPGVTALDVLAAAKYVVPALEIIDSRIADWKIKLADTVADNASCGKVVVGGRVLRADSLDLRLIGVVLERNGEIVATGAGAAALGNPAIAVAWLANKLATLGQGLKAGEFVLPGSLTAAFDGRPGDNIRATFDKLGPVSVRFA